MFCAAMSLVSFGFLVSLFTAFISGQRLQDTHFVQSGLRALRGCDNDITKLNAAYEEVVSMARGTILEMEIASVRSG